MKYIEDLRGIHKSDEIWVVGSGPSLDDFPDDFFDDKVSIALNGVFLVFPNCTYIHSCDIPLTKRMRNDRPELLRKCIFTDRPGRVHWNDHPEVILMRFDGKRGNKQDIGQVARHIVEENNCHYITVSTIAHTAIEAAAVLGAKKITLVGCEARTTKTRFHAHALRDWYKEQPAKYPEGQQKGTVPPFVDYRNGTRWLAEELRPAGIRISRYYYRDIPGYEAKAGYEEVNIEGAVKRPTKKARKRHTDYDATEVAVEVGSMRIRCTNPGTRKISIPWIDAKPVVFSRNGFAMVSDRMGCHLVRRCPAIEEVKPAEIKKRKARKSTKSRGKAAPPTGTYHKADSKGRNEEGE